MKRVDSGVHFKCDTFRTEVLAAQTLGEFWVKNIHVCLLETKWHAHIYIYITIRKEGRTEGKTEKAATRTRTERLIDLTD